QTAVRVSNFAQQNLDDPLCRSAVPELRQTSRFMLASQHPACGGNNVRGIIPNELVGAFGYGNWSLRVFSQRQTGYIGRRLSSLNTAEVRQHKARLTQQEKKIEVAERRNVPNLRKGGIGIGKCGELLLGTRVNRENDRNLVRNCFDRRQHFA